MKNKIKKDIESKDYSDALKIWEEFCSEIQHGNRFLVAQTDAGKNLLEHFGEKMSEKIQNNLEYISLQFVIEYIKQLGFLGFSFDSSLNKGHNYVLFTI